MVGGVDGVQKFYSNKNKSTASSTIRREVEDEVYEVKQLTLSSILIQENIDYVDVLKIDIEGSEFEILKTLDWHDKVGYVIGELHYDLAPNVNREEFESKLKKYFDLEVVSLDKPQRYLFRGLNKKKI